MSSTVDFIPKCWLCDLLVVLLLSIYHTLLVDRSKKYLSVTTLLPLPQPTLSVAGFRSDNGMCFNQFALFTIFESIIYRVYGMIYHLRIAGRSLTSLNLLLTNFRVNRSKTEIVSQKTKLLLGSKSLTVVRDFIPSYYELIIYLEVGSRIMVR